MSPKTYDCITHELRSITWPQAQSALDMVHADFAFPLRTHLNVAQGVNRPPDRALKLHHTMRVALRRLFTLASECLD